MAAFEVIALDTATPQLRAPGASDTYTFHRAVEMPLGTANGVLYLDGSKVVTSGSVLTFDGAILGVNGVSVGRGAGAVSTNTAVGYTALNANTSGQYNAGFGYEALKNNTTGNGNNAFGIDALLTNTTGSSNSAFGFGALQFNTTASNNTAVGYQAGYSNTTATDVVALGYRAAYNNTTALGTVAIGAQAGLAVTTGNYNVFVGPFAGQGVGGNITGAGNTAIGPSAGASLTTGSYNSFFGPAGQVNQGPGGLITTGSKNTILGAYNGNQGGLDIRTANNYIVLSDGDGNPRVVGDGSGNFGLGAAASPWATLNALQIGRAGFAGWPGTDYASMTSNAYYTGSGGIWNYIATDFAARYSTSGGSHVWASAPSGTAGTNISFTQVLAVDRARSLALEGASTQSGTGITFPATQSASSNANTLDDYEEGTWTPTFLDVTYTASSTYTAGRYTKIGRVVTVVGVITTDSLDTSDGSGVIVGGLPFTIENENVSYTPVTLFVEEGFNASGIDGYMALGAPGTTNINFYTFTKQSSSDNYAGLLYNQLTGGTNGTRVRFQLTYIV
jgi:hypothetical protein